MPLFIVATPIGNLEDITFRAVRVLKESDLILAEDTRVSRKLLDHYGIVNIPLSPYHDFNKEKVTPSIITRLQKREKISLISDAGTPGIADPAFFLVREAIRNRLEVIPIPGPSAHIAAIVASGLPTDRFIFENFLPHKSTKRREIFSSLLTEKRTVIFYETPHRIIKVLKEIDEILGDVIVVIGRELTKIYEEFLRGTPSMLIEHFTNKPPRGEMVVMLNPRIRDMSLSSEGGESKEEKLPSP
ncbi:MAG: 16S rRNA (cytidine(1402)-2'-O)-methyltransferase [Chitinispirillaceae bacterium]|nr:16S rRNA (cytidine(1402)-2'-O)-methyltransferase [Chitinispirillaceae bacterium]